MGCVCDIENARLKDEYNLCSKNNDDSSLAKTSPKTHRTPVAYWTRILKKVDLKPHKNKYNMLRDFRLITGADVVRALTFD